MATPKARLTSVRIEAEGVSAAAVERYLVAAGLCISDALGGEASYGEQLIETVPTEPEGSITYHKGRAKIWPNTADDSGQHVILSAE